MDVQSLESLAHYRILSQLGRGGMGVVYLAEDSRLGRQVAVKVMSETVAKDPAKRQRFLQEARAAAALNHPNIATIHAVEEEAGTLLLVMEYIAGETLESLVRRNQARAGLAAGLAVNLLVPVAAALTASHRRGIVHRDIKSSNIMLSHDGRVKVLDFGIAKMTGSSLQTDLQTVMGTLDYMSPEQARGELVDHRTDLWSLGIILHELLTGELPFHAESAATVLYNIVHAEPKILTAPECYPGIAPSLREILRRALAKDRGRRYQSGDEMERELGRWLRQSSSEVETQTFDHAIFLPQTLPPGPSPFFAPRRNTAERRQITFLYCELAHGDAGDGEQDPEEYAAALNRLSEISNSAAERYGGHVPEGTGSGLIYFGYPAAHEDDASRAIHAGIEIRDQARAQICGNASSFEIHLGVSTSLAVVESTQTRTGALSETIIGEGAKVARALAQLQRGSLLLIESSSQRLAARGIEYRSLGAQPVPGVREAMTVYEAIKNSPDAGARFWGDHTPNFTPLAGRKQELALLLDHWSQALDSHGQLVLVAGSAGMGKSRLIHELKNRIDQRVKPLRVECFCSPFYTSSALHPVLGFLERTYLESDSGRVSNLEAAARLRALLEEFGLDAETYLQVLAPLLSITLEPPRESTAVTPDRQRAIAIEALLSILLESAARQPLLLVVEDLHWADPSTLELLGMLLDYVPGLPILAVLTHRPEFIPPWPIRGHVSSISVSRLPREEVIALAMGVAGPEGLHPSVLEQVVHNADGTPLFIEELATMVIESGMAEQPLDVSTDGPKLAIPKTLRDSFMARLDRLGDAKHVAQTASVLGRDFPRSLLSAIAGVGEDELKASLRVLVEAEVLYLRGTHLKQSFVFKHALLQEAAYESLVRKHRVALHIKAAHALEKDAELIADQPELTGHHYQEAGAYPEAIRCWHRSGMKALERSAHREAIAAFQRALRLQKMLPPGGAADETELLLLTSLGPSLVATLSFGAQEVGRNFDRAHDLCASQTGSSLLLAALFGVWLYKLVRGDLPSAEEVAQRLVTTGEANGDDDMRIEGYFALGNVQFWQGNLDDGRRNVEKTIQLYEPGRFATHAHRFSQDPMVAAQCYLGFILMIQGETEAAWRANQCALTLARDLKHAFSIGWALGFPPTMAYFQNDPESAIRHADVATQFYAEQAFPFFITSCQATKGWGLCQLGRCDEGLELIRSALSGMRLIGSELVLPLFTGLLAESLLLAGETEAALGTVREGIGYALANGAKVSEICLHRICGDILLAQAAPDLAAARSCFERSAALAKESGANRFRDVAAERLQRMEVLDPTRHSIHMTQSF